MHEVCQKIGEAHIDNKPVAIDVLVKLGDNLYTVRATTKEHVGLYKPNEVLLVETLDEKEVCKTLREKPFDEISSLLTIQEE